MKLDGKRALITGASRGIGKAIALAFANEGADIVITASRSIEALNAVSAQIEARGHTCVPMAWDVRDVSQTRQHMDKAAEALGRLDIVVNNAGVLHLPKTVEEHGEEAAWDYIVDTNLKAVWFMTEEAAKLMARNRHGAIINIASDFAFRGANTIYGVSKWGVAGLTRGLGHKWAKNGIRINAIGPGPVATDMTGWSEGDPLDNDQLPIGRFTLPEEVASVAVFLASADASAVIGETIVLNSSNP